MSELAKSARLTAREVGMLVLFWVICVGCVAFALSFGWLIDNWTLAK